MNDTQRSAASRTPGDHTQSMTHLGQGIAPSEIRKPTSVEHQLASQDAAPSTRHAMISRGAAYVHNRSNARYLIVLVISVVSLLMSLLNFGLITGALRVPTPGLQAQGTTVLNDGATYGFEYDTQGWQSRGVAMSAVWNNTHRFAGQGALEVQVAGIDATQKAFVYITVPPAAKPGSTITAHLYVPTGTPPLVSTVYVLDDSWTWSSGAYPSLNPGAWTAVTYTIPPTLKGPVRELGVMIVGVKGNPPYTGPLFVDSVNIQK